MNRIFTLLVLLFSLNNFSQTIVDFKFYNSCEDIIVDLDYSLYKLDDVDIYYSTNDKDSILKIENGVYIVDVNLPDGENFKSFLFTRKFNQNKTYLDTIETPKIMNKYKYTGGYGHIALGFFNCDKICNGYIIDKYVNGQIRMEGNFENGLPKKEIKKYNKNGELIEIEIYDKKGTYKKSKYPDYEKYLNNN